MRIILYTGKGGVGKTSIAAATACKLAAEGKKVLVMSTDQAHSLGDGLERKLENEPVSIMPNLTALEVDVVKESEAAWGNLKGYLKQMLTARAEGGLEVEELLVFPGLEELFSLFRILDIYEENQVDVLIVDCAPTGETLSLLKFPELFGSFMKKILPSKRKAVKVMGPAVEKLTKIPMPKESVFDDLERLLSKLTRLQELMQNKDVVSLRIVTTAEKIVIREAKRNFTCLHLYNYNVDAIIVNKVYPKQALYGYFQPWTRLQEEGLAEISDSFRDIPRFMLPLRKKELKSIDTLLEASEFYGDAKPEEVLFRDKIFELDTENGLSMKVYLPFADKEELGLAQEGEELKISVKNETRRFVLPDALKGKSVKSARFTNSVLQIEFE